APGFVPTDMHRATLEAGEERAGRMQFQRTKAILSQQAPSMENVVNCVKMMISPSLDELTGKTISSNFDPWQTHTFREKCGSAKDRSSNRWSFRSASSRRRNHHL